MRYYLYADGRGFTLATDVGVRIIPILERGHMGARPLPQLREVDAETYAAAGVAISPPARFFRANYHGMNGKKIDRHLCRCPACGGKKR